METILIAGGTGLIGNALTQFWKEKGHTIRVLSRKKSDPGKGLYQWDPMAGTMDNAALEGVTVLVNLSGAGIADKRWTAKRKKELFDSRVKTTGCLWKYGQHSDTLKQYISASGVVCYGFDQPEKLHPESDPFGTDVLSQITREWEAAADLFEEKCTVTKLRISVVFAREGGALGPIAGPVKKGFGVVLGNGKQGIPWIHIDDLVRQFDFVLQHQLSGAFNTNAGNVDNETLTKTIAGLVHKPLWLPKAPAFALRLVLGEMAVLVLKGLKADSSRIRSEGFEFKFPELEGALKDVLK